ncbi:MAG: M56 family metallopeptidase [Chthoniobacterales bacterium]
MSTLLSVAAWVWEASWQASLIVVVILLAQWIFGSKISAGLRYGLWILVVARLLLPALPQSSLSIYNYTSTPQDMVLERTATTFIVMPVRPDQKPQLIHANAPVETEVRPRYWQEMRHSWPQILAVIWLMGACLMLGRLFFTYSLFRRRLTTRMLPVSKKTRKLLEESATHLFVRAPQIMQTDLMKTPALIGLFRPIILLPTGAEAQFQPAELRQMLLHELAHLKRGDLWMNWVVNFLRAAHWFNPVLWFGFRRMRADCEMACDALALKNQNGEGRQHYGQTLLKMLADVQPARIGMVGILEGQSQLRRRMKQIARGAARSWFAPVLCLVIIAAISLMTLTRAKQSPATSFDPSGNPQPKGESMPPISASARLEISAKFFEVPDTLSRSEKDAIDKLVQEGRGFNGQNGIKLLAMPMVTTKLGQPATIQVTKSIRYPVKYQIAANGERYPTSFESRDVGFELIDLQGRIENGKIFLQSKMRNTQFQGFIEDDPHFRQPVFETKESQLFRELENGKTVGFWLPGRQVGSNFPISKIINPGANPPDVGKNTDNSIKQMVVFLTARVINFTVPQGERNEVLQSLASTTLPEFSAENETLDSVLARLQKAWKEGRGPLRAGDCSITVNFEKSYPLLNFKMNNASIEDILKAIEKNTDFKWHIDAHGEVSVYFGTGRAWSIAHADLDKAKAGASSGNGQPYTAFEAVRVLSNAPSPTPVPLQEHPDLSYGKPVAGKPGFVTSPYAPDSGMVDLRGFPSGSQVKDPYTGRFFLTP